jgi:signal transduction histidine kinase
VEALEWLAEKVGREYELEVGFQSEIEHIMLPDSKLILVYRAVQEVLNNVVKHAHATKVNLDIMKEDHERFMICVKDNGVGFEKHKATGKSITGGFGLFAVRERIEELSGNIEIHSEKEKGTKVKIIIPLNKS